MSEMGHFPAMHSSNAPPDAQPSPAELMQESPGETIVFRRGRISLTAAPVVKR
jgi:hypothetical protein